MRCHGLLPGTRPSVRALRESLSLPARRDREPGEEGRSARPPSITRPPAHPVTTRPFIRFQPSTQSLTHSQAPPNVPTRQHPGFADADVEAAHRWHCVVPQAREQPLVERTCDARSGLDRRASVSECAALCHRRDYIHDKSLTLTLAIRLRLRLTCAPATYSRLRSHLGGAAGMQVPDSVRAGALRGDDGEDAKRHQRSRAAFVDGVSG